MHKNFEKLKDRVDAVMRNMFAGYHYVFDEDPEDCSVIYVNLYDVDPKDIQNFKKIIRREIRDVFKDEDILFVPAIFTTEETRMCYGEEFLRVPTCVFIDEADLSLHGEALLKIKYALKNYDSPFETKCDFPSVKFPEQEKHTFGISPVEGFEDGGCGYAGEKCRLAA